MRWEVRAECDTGCARDLVGVCDVIYFFPTLNGIRARNFPDHNV